MPKPVFQCAHTLVVLSLLGLVGCYAKVEVSDSSAEKAIAIDWVDPPCAEPGSAAGYIEGNGFGAENVTVTVGGIEAQVLAATGKDASFVVPEGLPPGPIEVVVMNPGGRIATIQWVVCGFDCSAIDCDDGNECTTDTCDSVVEECVHTPVGDDTACDFGGLPGVCIAGFCEEDLCAGVDCDDGEPCTADSCEPSDGSCVHTVVCPDRDGPVITNIDFDPKSVDVTLGSADVTVTAHVSDVLSGVQIVQAYALVPSGFGSDPACSSDAPASGDVFDGVWTCTLTIPQGVEPGDWRIGVYAYDLAGVPGNGSGFSYAADRLSVTATVVDRDGPVITNIDFDPKSVDVTLGSADVTVTAHVSDVLSGVQIVQAYALVPSGFGSDPACSSDAPASGDVFDGVWTCTLTIPQGVEPGDWRIGVYAYDLAGVPGNGSGFSYAADRLSVTATVVDRDGPVITNIDFDPKSVDVTLGSADVTVTAHVSDVLSGVQIVQAYALVPSGFGSDPACSSDAPASGDVFDGVWTCTLTIPQGVEPGDWRIGVYAYDLAGVPGNGSGFSYAADRLSVTYVP